MRSLMAVPGDGATARAKVLRAFHRALSLETHHLSKDPGLLFQQLQNRLQWEDDEVRSALDTDRPPDGRPRKAVIRLKTRYRESKALVGTIDAHRGPANDCAISLDGEYVLSVGADGMARQWDRRTGQEIRSVSVGPPGGGSHTEWQGGATCCALSPNGEFVICGGAQGSVCIWEPSTGRELWRSEPSAYTVSACSILPDEAGMIWVSMDEAGGHFGFHGSPLDSVLHIRESSGETRRIQVRGHVRACVVSPDGRLLAMAVYGGMSGHVEVRNLRTGVPLWKGNHPPTHTTVLDDGTEVSNPPMISDCAFSPDGALIVTVSSDSTLRLWSARSGTWVRSLTERSVSLDTPNSVQSTQTPVWEKTACAVTPDGEAILSGSRGGDLTLWDAASGTAIAGLSGHGDEVTAVTVGPDGRFAVSASRDETVRIWDLDFARGG